MVDAAPHTIAIDARKIHDFGIGTYVRNLVRELGAIDSSNRYLLFAGARGREELSDLPENFQVVPQRSPVYSIRELFTVAWDLYRLEIDLYHATHYILPLVVPAKTVVTIHDIIHLLHPEFLPHRLAFHYAERMIRHSLRRGDRILTGSHNTKQDLEHYFGYDGRKIEVIYYGIEDLFHRDLEDDDLRGTLQTMGLPESGYLLFVGNPKPHKNLDRVVQAYARALELDEFPHPLVCVGDRSGIEFKIRQRAEQLGMDERILLLGHVDQEVLPAIYQGATLFLYPTLYEGFGLPVVEAMASNTPVITSNTSALKEIAAGYATLVNPLDTEAMARAIIKCLTDDKHRASLSRMGLRRSQDFSWRRTAEKTLQIYEQVLAS